MSSRLKILVFDGSLKTTTFIDRLVNGLAKKHSVHFMGFGGSPNVKNSNVHYHNLGSSVHSLKLFSQSLKIAFQLLLKEGNISTVFKTLLNIVSNNKERLKQQNFTAVVQIVKPDILHLQWPTLLPYCEDVLQNENIKVVLSQRGYQNNVRPFVDASNFNYLKNQYPNIDGFHSVSSAILAVGDRMYSSENKVNAVVYSGFNFDELQFNKSYKKNELLTIISIGRPHWKKGYSYALHAMRLLKEQGISFQYKIIGGAGNEELLYLINEFNLQFQVSLLGKIPQKEVYDTMQQSDLLLLPSLEEGLPNVMIEAMALGLPVIATDCGGVSELLDANTGVIIPTRNANGMASALIAFTKTPLEIINERRIAAREIVEMRHSEEKMVNDMEKLYTAVLKAQ